MEELAAEGPIPEELETPGAEEPSPVPPEVGRPSPPASPPPGEEQQPTEGPAREVEEVEDVPGPDLHRPSIHDIRTEYRNTLEAIAEVTQEFDRMVEAIEAMMNDLFRPALELRPSRNRPDGDGNY